MRDLPSLRWLNLTPEEHATLIARATDFDRAHPDAADHGVLAQAEALTALGGEDLMTAVTTTPVRMVIRHDAGWERGPHETEQRCGCEGCLEKWAELDRIRAAAAQPMTVVEVGETDLVMSEETARALGLPPAAELAR